MFSVSLFLCLNRFHSKPFKRAEVGLCALGWVFSTGWINIYFPGEALQGTPDHEVQPDGLHQQLVSHRLYHDPFGHR